MAKQRHDWEAIRRDYVEGILDAQGRRIYPTAEDLAEKHGPHVVSIRRRAAKGTWLSARTEFATRVTEARQDARVKDLAAESADFDLKMLAVAKAAIAVGSRLLADIAGTQSRRVAGKDGEVMPPEKGRAKDYADVMNGLRNAQAIGRLALGDTTENVGINGNGGGVSGLLRAAQGDEAGAAEAGGRAEQG